MSDPKVEEIRELNRRGYGITKAEVNYLLTKLDEAEKANAWDGEWRTIPQTEESARRVLASWTKGQLVNFHIAAWQRELQRDEFWRSNLTARAEAAEERERVLIAGVKEIREWHLQWGRDSRRAMARAALDAILSRLLPSTPQECRHLVTQNKFGGDRLCLDCNLVVGRWKDPQPRLSMTLGSTPTEEGKE